MKYVLITFLTLIISSNCEGINFVEVEKPVISTPIISPSPIHTKLPEGWKIQQNEKNEYRLLKPCKYGTFTNNDILVWWGDNGGSRYKNIQSAIDSAWDYIQRQIDNELESKWHDVKTNE